MFKAGGGFPDLAETSPRALWLEWSVLPVLRRDAVSKDGAFCLQKTLAGDPVSVDVIQFVFHGK